MSKSTVKKVEKYKRTPECNVGIFKRFFAYLLDFYLGMLFCSLPIVLANGIVNQNDTMQMNLFFFEGTTFYVVSFLSLLMGFIYYVFIPWKVWKGQTFAKHLFHFKIVQMDGDEVDMRSLFFRQVIGIFIVEGSIISCSSLLRQILTYMTSYNFVDTFIYVGLAITIVSSILMVIGKNHRMIHDFIGSTIVVQTN